MVALLKANGDRWNCGGTLVASKYVITAAHCLPGGVSPSDIKAGQKTQNFFSKNNIIVQIKLGDHDFASTGEGSLTEMTIDVTSFTNHENYAGSPTWDYDIAIIELAQEVDLTIYTPACMAKASDTTTFDGKNALVYGETVVLLSLITVIMMSGQGWGRTSDGGTLSEVLLEVEVPVVTNAQCQTTMTGENWDSMICAGGLAGKDACSVNDINKYY